MPGAEQEDVGHADGTIGLFDGDGSHDPLPRLPDGFGESTPSEHGRPKGGVERRSDAGRPQECFS